MKSIIMNAWITLAFAIAVSGYGQGTLVFNNLGLGDEMVYINRGMGAESRPEL